MSVPTACTEPARSGRAIRYIFFAALSGQKKDAAAIPNAASKSISNKAIKSTLSVKWKSVAQHKEMVKNYMVNIRLDE